MNPIDAVVQVVVDVAPSLNATTVRSVLVALGKAGYRLESPGTAAIVSLTD